ncbi:MAG TPA: hypothetical protein VLF71_06205 [Candidatus Saccharimonadales bacterium]|nr:hypothetical protein [Candidatus Saccharimonadales bacterium]
MKYFLGFLGVVALVILVFILVVRGFSSGSKQSKAPVQPQLSSYTNTSTVMRMTIEGPVVADANYDEIRVTVGRDANTVEIVNGYQNKVVQAKTYPNNSDAYGNFLRAIDLLGYTHGNTTGKLDDERGYCATGNRYVYEIISGSADVQRYWIGSCGVGTFLGKSANIRALFRAQIPDYSTLTSKLVIGSQ